MTELQDRQFGPGQSIVVGIGLTIAGVAATVVGAIVAVMVLAGLDLPMASAVGGAIVLAIVEGMYLVAGLLYVSRSRLRVDYTLPSRRELQLLAGGYVGSIGFAVVVFGAIEAAGLSLELAFGVAGDSFTVAEVLLTLAVFVVVAVSEEYFFRGVIQRRLALGLDDRWAIALAGLLFGTVHAFNYTGDRLAVVLATLALGGVGAVFGYVYQRSNNLTVPVCLHYCYNATLVLLALAGVNLV